jgi:iron complex transport system permease protein
MTLVSLSEEVSSVAEPRRSTLRRSALLGIGVLLLVVAVAASLAFGTRVVSWGEFVAGLTGNTDAVAQAAVAARVPRTILAILVGAMLAVAGASMQAVTRNPLADPGILGISFGAALAVVIGIAVFAMTSPSAYMLTAIVGAAAAAAFVYLLGSLGYGGATPMKLALAGAATSAACVALISAILLPRVDIMATFRHWQVGGVGGAGWDRIGVLLPFTAVGLALCWGLARGFNALALGDEVATGLGERVMRTRLLGWIGAVILCGSATAIVGPIAFVGLVVPHVTRLIFGPDYRWLLPASIAAGAVLLLAADVVGRVIARPQEVEVGIVVALVGAPFFVWLVRRQKVREL